MEICVHTFALTPSVHHPGRDKGKVDVPIYIKQKLICPKSGRYRCFVLGANFNVCLVVKIIYQTLAVVIDQKVAVFSSNCLIAK